MGVLGSARAVAAVSFEQVEALLTEPGSRVLLGLDQANPAGVAVDFDPATATVGMQGQFWYRGEFTFAPQADGTEVTYRLMNVSSHPDAVIRVWQRGKVKRVQADVETFAAELPTRLG